MGSCQKFIDQMRPELLARKLAPHVNRLDVVGRDYVDYKQSLCIKAWLLTTDNRHCFTSEEFKRWKFVSLRNYFFSLYKKKKCGVYLECVDSLPDIKHPYAKDLERTVENYHMIKKIKQKLKPKDWRLLEDYMYCGCSSICLWEMYKKAGIVRSYRGLCRSINRVKRICRAKVKKF